MRTPKDKLFVSINYCETDPKIFFKPVNLGHENFPSYINEACDETGVDETGVCKSMTTHCTRTTVHFRLFEEGHADASVALRSGHCDHRSFVAAQELRGRLGVHQQGYILQRFWRMVPTGVEVKITKSESAFANGNERVNGYRELLAGRPASLSEARNVLQSVGIINGNEHINMIYEDPSGRPTTAPSSEY